MSLLILKNREEIEG